MKIGNFSKENNVSIDTVRYYIEKGLIIPEKIGTQYDFDSRCISHMKRIKELKSMGYSIHEIELFFTFIRLGKASSDQEDEFYREYYESKYRKNIEDIKNLKEQNNKLNYALECIIEKPKKKENTIGVDLNNLKLLACHKCGNDLNIISGEIENSCIVNGVLKCKCGTRYTIENGILIVDKIQENSVTVSNVMDYINDVSTEYLKNLSNRLEWFYKKIDIDNLENDVIIDLGSGTGFLLRYILDDIPDSSVYIAIDHDIEKHIYLRNLLKKADKKINIMFICSDFKEMHLKENIVDFVIDGAGSSNYGFENKDFLLKTVDKHFKKKLLLLSSYIMFEKYGINSCIEEEYRINYNKDYVRNNILELGYEIIDERTLPSVSKGGPKYENYFKEDEKVYTYGAYGIRK